AECVAARAAAETVVELFLGLDAEGGGFLGMEGAEGGIVLAGLAQLDALVDHIDDVDAAKQVVNKGLWNQSSHMRTREPESRVKATEKLPKADQPCARRSLIIRLTAAISARPSRVG